MPRRRKAKDVPMEEGDGREEEEEEKWRIGVAKKEKTNRQQDG